MNSMRSIGQGEGCPNCARNSPVAKIADSRHHRKHSNSASHGLRPLEFLVLQPQHLERLSKSGDSRSCKRNTQPGS